MADIYAIIEPPVPPETLPLVVNSAKYPTGATPAGLRPNQQAVLCYPGEAFWIGGRYDWSATPRFSAPPPEPEPEPEPE